MVSPYHLDLDSLTGHTNCLISKDRSVQPELTSPDGAAVEGCGERPGGQQPPLLLRQLGHRAARHLAPSYLVQVQRENMEAGQNLKTRTHSQYFHLNNFLIAS